MLHGPPAIPSSLVALMLLVVAAPPVNARPGGPAAWCEAYPDAALCSGQTPTCKLCHTSTGASAAWNPYGLAVMGELLANLGHTYGDDASFSSLVGQAAHNIEAMPFDHDGDGISTTEEIALGTGPGDVLDAYVSPSPPLGDPNPVYAVGAYDYRVAFARVNAAFCGQSPTYEEREAFSALANDVLRREALHEALDTCLRTPYWRNEALARLADDFIKPIQRFEQWVWDYRLWCYANLPPCDASDESCGDALPRSARDLLTGTYHVREREEGKLERDPGANVSGGACSAHTDCAFDEACNFGNGTCRVPEGYQPLQDTTKRAGMVTTTWFHFFFTMFSGLPRTTASQAMRSYLGVDIAKQQGLVYVADEPHDVDNKGVDQVGCYECHMQLDTASYAFAYYNGIGDQGGGASAFNPNRPVQRGLWAPGDERTAMFFGTPVADLPAWAAAAVESDFFKRNHTLTFFRHATGRNPGPDDAEEVDMLWRSLEDDDYQTPALLHRIIDTLAFGGV